MNDYRYDIGTAIDCKFIMRNTFSNNVGTEIFARNLFSLNESIPSDRYIDGEYNAITRRTLLNEEEN